MDSAFRLESQWDIYQEGVDSVLSLAARHSHSHWPSQEREGEVVRNPVENREGAGDGSKCSRALCDKLTSVNLSDSVEEERDGGVQVCTTRNPVGANLQSAPTPPHHTAAAYRM